MLELDWQHLQTEWPARLVVGKGLLAARVAYILYFGEPLGEMLVCHDCDNVLCVNPVHLWLGTNAENSQDMVNKGRTRKQDGSLNSMAVLDEEKVAEIKELLRKGVKQSRLAKRYNVTHGTISFIARGETWRHVP